MKTNLLIEPIELLPTGFSGQRPDLHVVLVYEDFEMGVEGKKVFDLIAKEAGGEDAARLTVWRFDFFHSSALTLAVSRQAEEADVIIVAPRDHNHLPPQVKKWLERWPSRRRLSSGALVAVFHPESSVSAGSSEAALLLWRAAERSGMDYFCRRAGFITSGTGRTQSTSTASLLDASNHLRPLARQWGVNE